ncbi:MAG: AAA family ATPase [Gammaproteobacteria bacterium]|nr:AAA family ATPase [Gammaproteobacteria bacterium]
MNPRLLNLPERSFFLFGPRGTGKSVWLNQTLANASLRIDLLKSGDYLRCKRDPEMTAREVAALEDSNSWIVIDEVQKLPQLLNEIHAILFEREHFRFALSGSSTRTGN